MVEPVRPPGFVSGGYRYQDEVMRRLMAQGIGRQVAVSGDHLAATIAAGVQTGETVVVDGLFVEHLRSPLPASIVALLHAVPTLDPWCERPLRVIATSTTTADAVRAGTRSVTVVRPGLNACFRPPATPEANPRLRIVCVGTVCAAKGQRLVAESLATSPARHQCELILLGCQMTDPAYVESVRAAAGEVPITFRGPLAPDEVARELQRADLFVSASRRESFGMAVAEAAACGVPVLAFDTGEIAASVGAGGWVLDGDADDASFAGRLASLLTNHAELRRVRARAARPSLPGWDAVAAAFAAACFTP